MQKLFFALGVAGLALAANAQQIADRTTLNSILTSSTTDDFEAYVTPSAEVMDVSTLDSTSIIHGQGPNLVNPGAMYGDPNEVNLQWNGNLYFGINTKSILSNSSTLWIDYAGGVDAFGLDVRCFEGFGYDGTLDVMSGATLLGTINFSLAGNAGESVFLGWQSSSPITRVVLNDNLPWSPIIDDHTYGAASSVPEPASLAVLGLGALALVRRRRK